MALPYIYSDRGKKEQVIDMFDSIASKYDFLNHFLSLNIDSIWRKKAVKALKQRNPKTILDIATGTADFAILSAKKLPVDTIVGVDISENMLKCGEKKIAKYNLANTITLQVADAENLPFSDSSFDAITVGFGVRNFEHLQKGLQEMHRVLNDNGVAAILEFSMPTHFPIKQLYTFYFKNILPFIGNLFSKNYDAYYYLFRSVQEFPHGEKFALEAKKAGFSDTKITVLSFGIASLYLCNK